MTKSKTHKSGFVRERSTRITDNQRKKDHHFFQLRSLRSPISGHLPETDLFSGLKVIRLSPGQTDSQVDHLGLLATLSTCFDLRSRSSRSNLHTFFTV